jgi:hypothetical protein
MRGCSDQEQPVCSGRCPYAETSVCVASTPGRVARAIFIPAVHSFLDPQAPRCRHGAIPWRADTQREHEEARAVAALVSVRELRRGTPLLGTTQLMSRLRPLPLSGCDQTRCAHGAGLRIASAGRSGGGDGPLGRPAQAGPTNSSAGSERPIRVVRTIRSCSLVCATAYPSPGLARGGRPM